jgi:hypothetical protein
LVNVFASGDGGCGCVFFFFLCGGWRLCLKKKVRFPFVSLGECVSWRKFGIFPFCFVLFNGIPRPPPL